MSEKIARIISAVFHPLIIPTLGFLMFFYSDFAFAALSVDAKRYVLLVVFFSTCILPLISIAILALNPRFDISMSNSRDRILPLFSTAVFYYIGFFLLGRMKAVPVFKLFLLASILVILVLMFVSYRWKISNHMASIGGLTGTIFALSFRTGVNPVYTILLVVLLSGLIGTSRLILGKHNLSQLVAGYVLGFLTLYLLVYFV